MTAVYEWDPVTVNNLLSEILDEDSDCAMAYWGLALLALGHLHTALPSEDALLVAKDVLAKRPHKAGSASVRELDYVDALSAYLDGSAPEEPHARLMQLARRMQDMAVRYPGDDEIKLLYAYFLSAAAPASDTGQLEAGRILESVLARDPEHPGALHLLLHTYDSASSAARGLESARRYADVSSHTPHALHLPSHIYSVLGLWHDVVQANRWAYAAAKAVADANWPGKGDASQLHCLDFEIYALLQSARDQEAMQVVRLRDEYSGFVHETVSLQNALAAIPARHALERRAWSEAAALEVRSPKGTYAEAITRYARAMGFAKTRQLNAAEHEMEALTAVTDALGQAHETFWREQAEILRLGASGWLALAQGKPQAALAALQQAVQLDASRGRSVAMENPLASMQEQMGDLLLELGEPRAALGAYETALAIMPNRFLSTYGAARAAALSADADTARRHYEKLIALTTVERGSDRAELREAKRFLAAQAQAGPR